MKEEYDFTNAERGKFYRPDAKLNIPVYLDDEVRDFVAGIAKQKHSDLNQVVNELLRRNRSLPPRL
uniref:BrnA antitoxin of type II toxin-antitoxin system n=1 Tax=Candidatus Kentrum sp. DK TaxID=2126562 RepID=A0A450SX16_9GAMM|nr:MAG: hypothetical protein BECKDK2373C_GA0170839_106521 [Candidatus Kentron sp. DK]